MKKKRSWALLTIIAIVMVAGVIAVFTPVPVKADGSDTFWSLGVRTMFTLLSGADFKGNANTQGANTFLGTATADTVTLAICRSTDIICAWPTGAIGDSSGPLYTTADSGVFYVHRTAAAAEHNQAYSWTRQKHY